MRRPASIALVGLTAVWGGWLSADQGSGVAPVDEDGGPPSCGSATLEQRAASAIREILDAGYRARQPDPASLERIASSAAVAGERDSRVEYARGLVLLKLVRSREAEAAFLAAAEARPPYLPAWQALIRTRLVLKEADAALERAEALALRIADPHAGWPDAGCRTEAARWLGRVAGYLALDGVDLLDSPALLTAHEARVRQALDGPLLAAHVRGRRDVYREHQALLAERARQKGSIETEQEQRQARRKQEIQAERAELDQRAETLEMTTREWQGWLDEQLRRTEKQLEVLQKDYAALDAAARTVSAEILERQRELTAFQLQANPRRADQRLPNPFTIGIAQREEQILGLQARFNALAAKAQDVSTRARRILAERAAAAQRFQRATGQLARRDATLQKWEKLLEKSADRNEPEAATSTTRYRLLTNRLTLPATYFELDPDVERERLLDEIGQAP